VGPVATPGSPNDAGVMRRDPDLHSGQHDSRGATVAQLRADIDSGRTGDKVAAIDHAAAPLGTEEEAAGTPVSCESIAAARRYECRHQMDRPASEAVAYWALPVVGLIVGLTVVTAMVLTGG
jgi:hypothetical protein